MPSALFLMGRLNVMCDGGVSQLSPVFEVFMSKQPLWTKERILATLTEACPGGLVTNVGYELAGATLRRILGPEVMEGGPYWIYTKNDRVYVECRPTGRVYVGNVTDLMAFAVRAGVADV